MGEVAVDTETSSLDPHQADLIGVSLSSKIGKACYIPIGHNSKKCIDKDLVLKKLKPLLEDQSIKKIGQNIKFDFIVLFKNGINITSMEDTMLMSYVLDAGKNRHNMDTLSEIHSDHKPIAFKDLVGTEAMINSMTPLERANPELINGSRRKRIARGSARSIQELNTLLKKFSEMKKLLKKMKKKQIMFPNMKQF